MKHPMLNHASPRTLIYRGYAYTLDDNPSDPRKDTTTMNTIDRVKALIADQAGLPASDIADDAPLGARPDTHPSALKFDSLDHVELVIAVEDHFGIEVLPADEKSEALDTPAGIAAYVDGVDDRAVNAQAEGTAKEATEEAQREDEVAAVRDRVNDHQVANTPTDYAAMSPGDMFTAVGSDVMKWADAFMQIACFNNALGRELRAFPHGDRAPLHHIMFGWFANVIEAGRMAGYSQGITAGLGMAEIDFGADDIAWDSRNRPDRHVDFAGEQDAMGRMSFEPGYTGPFRNPHPDRIAADYVRFRKKPVEIEAVKFAAIVDGVPRFHGDPNDLPDWLIEACAGPEGQAGSAWVTQASGGYDGGDRPGPVQFLIGTLEGRHVAQDGDWIIRGVNGELYPCKPDIFAKTYDPVSDEEDEMSARAAVMGIEHDATTPQ